MAKTSGQRPRVTREGQTKGTRSTGNPVTSPGGEDTLVDMAEDLGKLLGTAQNRMETWLGERQELTAKLIQIRDTANQYLRDLTAGGANIAAAIERGRRSTSNTSTEESAAPPKTSARKRPKAERS